MTRRADEHFGEEPLDGADAPERTLADHLARRRLVAIAGHEGDAGIVTGFLHDDDPGVRATALQALARCGALSDAVLAEAAADPSVTVRRRVAELLGAHPAAVSLVGLLDDVDVRVVEMAAWAAGERHQADHVVTSADATGDIVARLSRLAVDHDDPLVREAAVAALGSIGDEAGLAAVLRASGDKITIRRRAVIALAAFEGPEVDAALEAALEDRDWHVRQTAEDLLG